MSKTIEKLKEYVPFCYQEEGDKNYFIKSEQKEQILTRENENCHLTASAFIINKKHNKVLSVFHNIYKSWSLPGGHADGIDDMLFVSKKEANEETGIKKLRLLKKTPISIDSLTTDSHFKNNKFVPAHIHLNFCYLFEADENQKLTVKKDENSSVKWLEFNKLLDGAWEPQMKKVYQKIIGKIELFFKGNLNDWKK